MFGSSSCALILAQGKKNMKEQQQAIYLVLRIYFPPLLFPRYLSEYKLFLGLAIFNGENLSLNTDWSNNVYIMTIHRQNNHAFGDPILLIYHKNMKYYLITIFILPNQFISVFQIFQTWRCSLTCHCRKSHVYKNKMAKGKI